MDDATHDLAPWIETPSSSRVSRFRYDHGTRAVQVQWRNNTNHGYVYEGVGYEEYRQFARAASKGRKINSMLNGYPYRLMTSSEVEAASNANRRGLASRITP